MPVWKWRTLMSKGRTYWITGLPGSGKTTIGSALYYRLKEKHDNAVILDGDILKKMVGDMVGYTDADRLARGKRYSEICKLLSDQGLWVVICTVAMFEEIRRWNRDNIDGYIEVYINPSIEVLRERNRKNLYTGLTEEYFLKMEEPVDPDLILENGKGDLVQAQVEKILYINPRKESNYDRDTEYWDNYYNTIHDEEPSPFAEFVWSEMKNDMLDYHILDLGCGNGRDSEFFLKKGFWVTGIDASNQAITGLNVKYQNNNKARFVCDDCIRCRTLFQTEYDIIYMRWFLHAISEEQEEELFLNLKDTLTEGGKIYIEARTTSDELYGKGEKVGKNAYILNNHYRRFINTEVFQKKIHEWGFSILSLIEGKGFAPRKDQDPTLCRIILCRKKDSDINEK